MRQPDDLMIGGYKIWQDGAGFRSGTDAVRLFELLPAQGGRRVAELCAGTGAVALMLLASGKAERVTTVEIDSRSVSLCRESARQNGCENRLEALCGDIKNISDILFKGSFDTVAVNPPYYPVGSGILPKDPAAAAAKFEIYCTIDDVLAAASYLTCKGGMLYMIHLASRREEILSKLKKYHFEPTGYQHTESGGTFLLSARKTEEETW